LEEWQIASEVHQIFPTTTRETHTDFQLSKAIGRFHGFAIQAKWVPMEFRHVLP
jgi:hypothetical protein